MVPNPLAGDPGLSAASPLSSGRGQGCGGLGCGRRERGVHGRPGSPALVGARQRPRRPQRRQDCRRGGPGNSNPRHPGAGEDPAAPATLARPVMRAWRLRPPRSWRPGAGVRPTPTTSPPRAYSPARPVRRRLSLRPSTSCHLQGIYSCGARSPSSSLATCVTSTADGPRPRGPYVAHPVLHC